MLSTVACRPLQRTLFGPGDRSGEVLQRVKYVDRGRGEARGGGGSIRLRLPNSNIVNWKLHWPKPMPSYAPDHHSLSGAGSC